VYGDATSKSGVEDQSTKEARKLLTEFWRRSHGDPNWINTLSKPLFAKVQAAIDLVVNGGNQLVETQPGASRGVANQNPEPAPVEDPKITEAKAFLGEFQRRRAENPAWVNTLSKPVVDKILAANELVNGTSPQPVQEVTAPPPGKAVTKGELTPGPTRDIDPATQKLIDKMGRIMIPEIEFRQANIHDVVDFLVKASIAEDTSTDNPKEKGVNIILNLGGSTGGPIPEITMTARSISLLQSIKIITQVAGLKYIVGGKIVMIVPVDAPVSDI
jgi:hypothetical protein